MIEQNKSNWSSFQQFFRVQSPTPSFFKQNRDISLDERRQTSTSGYGSTRDMKRKSNGLKMKNENGPQVRIFSRFRPINSLEMQSQNGIQCVDFTDERTIILQGTQYTFDKVFNTKATQVDVFEAVALKCADDVIKGLNGTILAYGQTGSGKTYTMLGTENQQGIIYRTINYLLKRTNTLTVSLLEVYRESINDLLGGGQKDLKLKEDSLNGVYVERLSSVIVNQEKQFHELIMLAEENRHVSETRLNSQSSRSHLLLQVKLESGGRLNFVDLAGSEKVSKTGARGETLEEAKKINFSLSCLGHVVQSLASGNDHVPYRDSKLTRLLQESLQGSSCKTALIVTCSPHSSSLEETTSSLKFAQRAKLIKPAVIIRPTEIKRTHIEEEMQQLRQELQTTKTQLLQALQNQSCLQVQIDQLDDGRSLIKRTAESTPLCRTPLNVSGARLMPDESVKISTLSLESLVYEVQGKLSYFLSGFSQFIKDFNCTIQARSLSQQLLDLNQTFQSMATLVRAEEFKYSTQQKLIEEQQQATQLLKNALSQVRVTLGNNIESSLSQSKITSLIERCQIPQKIQTLPTEFVESRVKFPRVEQMLTQLIEQEEDDYNYKTPIGQVSLRTEESEIIQKENMDPKQLNEQEQKNEVQKSAQNLPFNITPLTLNCNIRTNSRKDFGSINLTSTPNKGSASMRYLKLNESKSFNKLKK